MPGRVGRTGSGRLGVHPAGVALLGAFLLAAVPARAQDDLVLPQTIVSVEGDPIPGEDVVEISGLEVGEELTPALARQAIYNLWDTGRVSDVRVLARPVSGGVAVRIEIRLNQAVRQLELDYVDGRGRSVMNRQEVSRAIGYLAGMAWQPDEMARMTKALRGAYDRRGYPETEVEGEIQPVENDPESVHLKLTIDVGEPIRVSRVSLRGDLGLPEAEVRRTLGLSAGDVYDQVALEEGLTEVRQLYRDRRYYQVQVGEPTAETIDGTGGRRVRLVIRIQAGAHYQLSFLNNRYFTNEDLEEVLALGEERELTRAVLDSLAYRLRGHYVRHGFYHARVDWRVTRVAPGQRRLIFRIRSGPRVIVREIDFVGNEHFEDDHLRRQIHAELEDQLGEEGIFRPVNDSLISDLGVTGEVREPWRPGHRGRPFLRSIPRSIYVEEVYRAALSHILDLYEADGYLQAQLGEPQLEFSDHGRLLRITIEVTEGPQTEVNSITFSGNEALSNEEILDQMDLALGDPLNRFNVEQARRGIVRAYNRDGYVYAAVTVEEYLSEDRLSADLRFDVVEGPQVRIGDIQVRGNDSTRTSLILDRVDLEEGEIFRPQDAADAERALIDLGIFTTVSVTLADRDEPAAIKDVIVEVTERRPQVFELRIGFSTADGPRGGIRYGYNNLFGYALGLDFRAQLSYLPSAIAHAFGTSGYAEFLDNLDNSLDRLERLVVLGFSVPHLPRLGRIFSLRLDGAHERDNDPAYAVTRESVTLTLSGGWRRRFTGQIQTGFHHANIAVVQNLPHCDTLDEEERRPGDNCLYPTAEDIQLERTPRGDNWFWVTRAQVALDYRDNPFNPTQGFYGAVSGEHAVSFDPVRRDVSYTDPETGELVEETEYHPSNLIKLSITLNGYIPLQILDIVLALQVRFGWVFPLVSDSRTTADRYFYLGGFDSLRGFPEESLGVQDDPNNPPGGNAMLNLRGELRIPLVSSFSLGLFVDSGNIWRDRMNMFTDEYFTLRVTLGAGIRLNTPVGPLALDVGFNPWRRGDEGLWNLHFAIGLF